MSKNLIAVLLALISTLVIAQNSPNSTNEIAAANAAIAKGDYAGAAATLEKVVARDPGNKIAWRSLGFAYMKLKKMPESRAAYGKLLELAPDTPQAFYNIGVGYAIEGNKDAAFEWLGKAKATKKLDMTMVQVDEDLKPLSSDPRFAALLPKPEDFANPFVESEKVQVIREWDGETQGDQFGWIARSIGDVDGDGVEDFVTSAPSWGGTGKDAGRVYVYSTKTGKLLWKVDGAPAEELGTGVELAGDTNKDGVPDVVAGAPAGGKSYIYSGKDGRVLQTLTAENKSDTFGRHTSHAGDVNGDGYADVLIGAPNNAAGGKDAGRAYLYSGKDGRKLMTWTGERAEDQFGSTVAGYTDPGGKTTFIMIGAPGAGPRKTGRVYVYTAMTQKPRFILESDETGTALGYMFLSIPGDLDGDGVPDLYATDFGNKARGPATGRAYAASGKTGARLLTLTGETQGEGFGIGPSDAGDVDGDGHADLIIGAWQYAGGAVSGGRAYLYSGKDGKLLKTYTCRIPGDTFGFDAVGMGDTDSDGTRDFLITSGWSGVKGNHSGRVFLISSGIKSQPKAQ